MVTVILTLWLLLTKRQQKFDKTPDEALMKLKPWSGSQLSLQ